MTELLFITVATVSFIAQLSVQLAGICVSTPLVQDLWTGFFGAPPKALHCRHRSCARATGRGDLLVRTCKYRTQA